MNNPFLMYALGTALVVAAVLYGVKGLTRPRGGQPSRPAKAPFVWATFWLVGGVVVIVSTVIRR